MKKINKKKTRKDKSHNRKFHTTDFKASDPYPRVGELHRTDSRHIHTVGQSLESWVTTCSVSMISVRWSMDTVNSTQQEYWSADGWKNNSDNADNWSTLSTLCTYHSYQNYQCPYLLMLYLLYGIASIWSIDIMSRYHGFNKATFLTFAVTVNCAENITDIRQLSAFQWTLAWQNRRFFLAHRH